MKRGEQGARASGASSLHALTPHANTSSTPRSPLTGLLHVSIGAPCDACLERRSKEGLAYSSIYSLNVSQGDAGLKLFARGESIVLTSGRWQAL